MTTCRDVDEVLEAYVDGDLSAEEQGKVEAHLAACSGCREKHAVALRVASEIRALPPRECPEHVARDALFRIREDRKGFAERLRDSLAPLRLQPSLKTAVGLAAAIVILIGLMAYPPWQWINGTGHPTQQEITQAKQVIGLAFGYVNHASDLAQKVLQKEDVPGKVITPIKRSFGMEEPMNRKGDRL